MNAARHAIVFGATGMVGSRVTEYLCRNNFDVLGLSRDPGVYSRQSSPNLKVHSSSDLPTAFQAELVINCAGPSASWAHENSKDIPQFAKLHAEEILEVATRVRARQIVNISTMHVYASNPSGTIEESHLLTNSSPYARMHAIMEQTLEKSFHTANLRLSNSFGYSKTRSPNYWTLVTHDLIRQLATTGKANIVGNPRSSRDFIPLGSAIEAIQTSIKNNLCGPFNVCSGKTWSLKEWARRLVEILEPDLEMSASITCAESDLDSENAYQFSNEKMRRNGWTPSFSQEEEVRGVFLLARQSL